jgi:hypothetical protein
MCQLSLNLPFGLIHARNRPLGSKTGLVGASSVVTPARKRDNRLCAWASTTARCCSTRLYTPCNVAYRRRLTSSYEDEHAYIVSCAPSRQRVRKLAARYSRGLVSAAIVSLKSVRILREDW